jgi:hypothetical protein
VLVALLVSLWLILQHLRSYSNPEVTTWYTSQPCTFWVAILAVWIGRNRTICGVVCCSWTGAKQLFLSCWKLDSAGAEMDHCCPVYGACICLWICKLGGLSVYSQICCRKVI